MTTAASDIATARGFAGFIDRAHRRLGWRLFPAYIATVWLVPLILLVPAVLSLGSAIHATRRQTDALMVMTVGLCLLCAGIAASLAVAWCRPQRQLAYADAAMTAERVWVSVLRLPARLIAASVALLVLVLFPLDAVFVTQETHFPSSQYPNALTATLVMAGLMAGVAGIASGAVVRPVLRELRPRLAGAMQPSSGLSLRRELRVIVPLIAVFTAAAGAGMAGPPSERPTTALLHIGVATAFSAAVSVPAAYLLANSVLHPLEELLAGAGRIKRGDHSTPVPALVPDEMAAVAQSFNESMIGLAERARLAEETRSLLDDVRASRARLVEAGDEARRRLERDIHDGVQQRIVGLGVVLGMLEDAAATLDRESLASRLRSARDELIEVLADLRDLARGQFPAVLDTDGLGPAVKTLAARAPMSVRLLGPTTWERYPAAVEATAYFVIAEALANVAKHADATDVELHVDVSQTALTVRVTDNGCGDARPADGSGLSGLADRVAAVNGALTIDSPPGVGTTVTAVVPLGSAPTSMLASEG